MRLHLVTASVCLALSATAAAENRVLMIGVDGLRPDMMLKANAPVFDALMRTGSFSLTSRNVFTPDQAWNGHSATNWGVMLNGFSPAVTGLTHNGDAEHLINDDVKSESNILSVFGRIKRHNPSLKTGVFNTWGGIGMSRVSILQDCRSTVDFHFSDYQMESSADRDVETVSAAVDALTKKDAGAVFVHLSQCDAAGHGYGYDSTQMNTAVEQIDLLLSRLVRATRTGTARVHNWLILLSADHGGPDGSRGHGDNTNPQTYTVPLLAWGGPFRHGTQFQKQTSLYNIVPTALSWLKVDSDVDHRRRCSVRCSDLWIHIPACCSAFQSGHKSG
jgi:predicted AlkP superfamily pyrophosphatase or phosphodiesterase